MANVPWTIRDCPNASAQAHLQALDARRTYAMDTASTMANAPSNTENRFVAVNIRKEPDAKNRVRRSARFIARAIVSNYPALVSPYAGM